MVNEVTRCVSVEKPNQVVNKKDQKANLLAQNKIPFCKDLQEINYRKITWICTHNSYCNTKGVCITRFKDCDLNQDWSIKEQLDMGVRGIDIEVRKILFKDDFAATHGPSWLGWIWSGYSRVEDILREIKDWIKDNPEEVITILINPQNKVEDNDWYNDQVKEKFKESGLDDYVYSYNDERDVNDSWPKIKDMVKEKKNIMVLGLKGIQNFKEYQNEFKSGDTTKPSWAASSASDLDPKNLQIELKDGKNRLFFCYDLYSERWLKGTPYFFGGNPNDAENANNDPIDKNIVLACNEVLKKNKQHANFILVDFIQPGDQVFTLASKLNKKFV